MKKIYKWLAVLTILLFAVFLFQQKCEAKETDENISVTVSSQLYVVFQEDGTNTISDYVIENHSPVPIHVTNVIAKMYNGWKLVPTSENILADQKRISVCFQGKRLQEGDNLLQMTIPEQETRTPNIMIERGAWTRGHESEKALELSIEYSIGTKEFHLHLDGGNETEQVTVQNGEIVKLPIAERIKYNFVGWEDEEGTLYTNEFVMPMRDVTLKAKWEWTEAYALYTAEDKTLTFVRSVQPIVAGAFWEGKKVSAVYTGFEDAAYNSNTRSPWWEQHDLERVEMRDVIQPKSTAYWFYGLWKAYYLDLNKLETSKVIDMTSMFSATGCEVTGTVTVKGLKSWNTSNVKYFGSMFRKLGDVASRLDFEDISGWDTSSGIFMMQMFLSMGPNCSFYVDCSNWNVANVQEHSQFKDAAGGTVVEPKWKV